jgi:hypothetical protein
MWNWHAESLLESLDDLPDSARSGAWLMAVGVLLGLARFVWPVIAPESFHRASAAVFRYVSTYASQPPSPGVFSFYLDCAAAIFFVCGAFIFFRKGVFWLDERKNATAITRLNLR